MTIATQHPETQDGESGDGVLGQRRRELLATTRASQCGQGLVPDAWRGPQGHRPDLPVVNTAKDATFRQVRGRS